jgi:hypothetical protein
LEKFTGRPHPLDARQLGGPAGGDPRDGECEGAREPDVRAGEGGIPQQRKEIEPGSIMVISTCRITRVFPPLPTIVAVAPVVSVGLAAE